MSRITVLGVLLVLVAFALPSAVAQDDAASGDDAPDEMELALDVLHGTISGAIDVGADDLWDWYRVDVPDGMGIQVTLRILDEGKSLNYRARSDIGDAISQGSADWGEPFSELVYPWHSEGLRVGLWSGGSGSHGSIAYALTLEPRPLPDIAVTHVEVVAAADGDVLHRDVLFTIENVGSEPAAGTSAWAYVRHPDSLGWRALGQLNFGTLAPGASVQGRFVWDTTGEIGTARVNVNAWPRYDGAGKNNRLEIDADTLVPGSPVSVDLYHAYVRADDIGPYGTTLYAYTDHNAWHTRARVATLDHPFISVDYYESHYSWARYDHQVILWYARPGGVVHLSLTESDGHVARAGLVCAASTCTPLP